MKFTDNDILYLDNHLIVVNKLPLLLTQPTNLCEDSVETRTKAYLKEKFNKRGNVFAHPVHRLDRVAGGIVVLARTSKALSRLNEQIRKGEWEKKYVLRHEGVLPQDEGELIHHLKRLEYRSVVDPNGKRAHLKYRKVDEGRVEVDLITGRYHQIRVQFSEIGCPICGDQKYGAKTKAISPGIDLYHISTKFKHPVTKKVVQIQIDPIF